MEPKTDARVIAEAICAALSAAAGVALAQGLNVVAEGGDLAAAVLALMARLAATTPA